MTLYFFCGEFNNPRTGGEVYNKAMLEGAKMAGWSVQIIELDHFQETPANIFTTNLFVLSVIKNIPKDAVLMFDFGQLPCYTLGVLFSKVFKGHKIIGMLHHYGYWDARKLRGRILQRFAAQLLSSQVDILCTNSNFSVNSFESHASKKIPIHLISPFIENKSQGSLTYNRSLEGKPRFLHVGTIQKRKNLHTTLKALAQLKIDFTFDIIGKWEFQGYKNELLDLVQTLGLTEKVQFHGRLSNEEMAGYLQNSTLFIMVSQLEGYGMVYTDAMKYGIPIIASDAGAIPEVVSNHINGILCSPNKVDQIARAIIQLLEDGELRFSMAQKNFEKYTTFDDRNSFIDKYKNAFYEIATEFKVI